MGRTQGAVGSVPLVGAAEKVPSMLSALVALDSNRYYNYSNVPNCNIW